MDPTPESQPETSTLHIPEGFTALVSPDGDRYIVPKFMIPATHQAFEAYRKQVELDVTNTNGCSGNSEGIPCILLGHKAVVFPADPPLTERELLTAHAEVKALQEQLSLSYKDASHWLYMAEWERLKADEEVKKFFTSLANRTKNSLANFQTRLSDIARTNGHPVNSCDSVKIIKNTDYAYMLNPPVGNANILLMRDQVPVPLPDVGTRHRHQTSAPEVGTALVPTECRSPTDSYDDLPLLETQMNEILDAADQTLSHTAFIWVSGCREIVDRQFVAELPPLVGPERGAETIADD
ncbi:hypothetical protein BDZ97DRAFT_1764653 [Flammula alnicola]|nr:hypothetical protein BDZ97DRAFT_1764653 [Flammula alnicola]